MVKIWVSNIAVTRDLLRAVGLGAMAKWAGGGSMAEDSTVKGTVWEEVATGVLGWRGGCQKMLEHCTSAGGTDPMGGEEAHLGEETGRECEKWERKWTGVRERDTSFSGQCSERL